MAKGYPEAFMWSEGLKNLLPSTVGFDKMLETVEQASKSVNKALTNYPPYNIKKVDDNKYVVELAVAGFGKQDLELTLNEGLLTIKGQTTIDTLTEDGVDVQYLFKGISDRAFARTFTLADTVEVKNAQLINGLLKIFLENVIPESKKPKSINIE